MLPIAETFRSLKKVDHAHPYTATPSDKQNILPRLPPTRFKIVFEHGKNIQLSILLEEFHKTLEPFNETMIERYGWSPNYEARLQCDRNSSMLAFAVTETHEIAAMVSLMHIDDDQLEMYYKKDPNNTRNLNDFFDALFDEAEDDEFDINYEFAVTVLPKYQRCGIGTELFKETWNEIKHKNKGLKTRLIALVNSEKCSKWVKKCQDKLMYIPIKIIPKYQW